MKLLDIKHTLRIKFEIELGPNLFLLFKHKKSYSLHGRKSCRI